MIKYILNCKNNHEFESWFSNSEEFEKLKKKKLLECIFCGSKKISKSIMAPMISVNIDSIGITDKKQRKKKEQLIKLRNYIENNVEYVGSNFSKKVREVYYDKNNKKTIYGTTSPKEREELAEEGINLLSVPWIDKDN